MALNPATLAAALQPDIKSAFVTGLGAVNNDTLDEFATLLATAIASKVVAHITSSAAVTVVTACPAGAGTGTGTVT